MAAAERARGPAREPATAVLTAALGLVAAGAEITSARERAPDLPWPPAAGAYLLVLLAAAPLVVRSRRPVAVACWAVVVCLAYRAFGYPGGAPGMVLFVTCYSVAVHAAGPWRRPLVIGAVAASALVPVLPPDPFPPTSWAVSGPAIGFVVAAMLGEGVRERRLDAEDRVRRAAEVAEARTAKRLAEDRIAIARDLHDVLAHTISVVTVQSGLALDTLDDSPGQARAALEAIRASSKEAMGQLRVSVRSLRGDGPADAPPALAGLAALAARAREAGLSVDLDADLDADLGDPVPAAVQATAYRIVQEALTNCVRHSTGHAVRVRLRRDARDLTVEITDDGCPPEGAARAVPGMGLTGIRERAEAAGGAVLVGWSPDGGFLVRATLPTSPDPLEGAPQ